MLPNGQLLGAYGREWREDQENTGDGAEEETCWKCLGSTWKPQKTKDRKAGLGPTKCTVCAGSGLVYMYMYIGLYTKIHIHVYMVPTRKQPTHNLHILSIGLSIGLF